MNIDTLQKMIDESNNIVFFGGAGVSTESGIKDFRSEDGLYKMKFKYPAEIMLSNGMFYSNTEEFYKFYKTYMNSLNAKPNITHNYLKKLEDQGKLKAIVTQNIDGLHQKAGSNNVYEIHGTINKNHCLKCGKEYNAEYVFKTKDIPKCSCGGLIKPNVVLYGEMLPEDALEKAQYCIYNADMLIVAGTSLTVEPAASLVKLFQGKHLVIINKDTTPYDDFAELVIHDNLKNIFSKLK